MFHNNTSRPQWFIDGVNYLVDHIFDFLTVGATLYVFVRHQFDPYSINDLPNLLSWIIGILGMLTISGMWERQRRLTAIERATSTTKDIVLQKLGGPARSIDFFWGNDQKVTGKDLEHAKTIYVQGRIIVEIYHHRTAEPNPTFELRSVEDAYWYGVFRRQFDLVWEICNTSGGVPEMGAQGSTKPASAKETV